MKALALAAIAAVLLTTPADARQTRQTAPQQSPGQSAAPASTSEPVSLNELIVVAPGAPTHGDRHDIELLTAKTVEVAATAKKVSGTVNGQTRALPNASVTLKPDCAKAGTPSFEVRPDRPCTLAVILGDVGEFGRYAAKIWLVGKVGPPKELEVEFARRRSIWCAVVLVVAGLLAGLIVTSWRTGGRERTRKIIAIKEAVEILTDLDTGPGRPPRMRLVILRAREMEAALLRGVPVDDSEIAELETRFRQYRFLLDIEARAADLPGDKAPLAHAIDNAIDAMEPLANGKLAAIPDTIFQAVRARFEELESAASAALQAADGQALPTDALPLPVTQRMSSRRARLAFAIVEWTVAAVLALVFVVVALGTLYVNNAYWGSYGDLLAAFMIGFGAFAGAAASVDSFLQRARTVPA
jgi:hypothetical protein